MGMPAAAASGVSDKPRGHSQEGSQLQTPSSPRVLEDVSLQVLPVKRKLSCSSHLSSLPITPHPEGSEVGAEQRGVNEKIKDADSTCPSLVLWREPAEVEAGGRRVIFNDRDNVVCCHFLFAFLPSEAHFSAPLKLDRTV